jgi:hypothetical protein
LVTGLLLAAALYEPAPMKPQRAWLVGAFSALFTVRLAAIFLSYSAYNADFADFTTVARAAPAHSLIGIAIDPRLTARDRDGKRCEMYAPLTIPLFGDASPLFAIASQQPMVLKGELGERTNRMIDSAHEDQLLQPDLSFNYYLACGYDVFPTDRLTLLAREGRFMLLRKK